MNKNIKCVIKYVNEGFMLRKLKTYCLFWDLENHWSYEKPEKPFAKYNEAKAKRLLEEKYIKAVVWWNLNIYCFNESDLMDFITEFLSLKK